VLSRGGNRAPVGFADKVRRDFACAAEHRAFRFHSHLPKMQKSTPFGCFRAAGIVHLSASPTRCVGILLARLNTAHFACAKPQNPQGSTFAYGARSVEISLARLNNAHFA
jgi:hypothetical protein